MDIKSIDNDTDYLFLSIDVSYFRKQEVLFTFLQRNENEARTFITNLIPFIRHKFPDIDMENTFLPEAIERHRDSIWNAETQEILSPEDLYLDQTADMNDHFNMIEALGMEITNQKPQYQTKEHERVQRLITGDENTSVGTLFTTDNLDLNTTTPSTYTKFITPSTTTARSQGTTLTIEEVDSKLNSLSVDMQKLHQLLFNFIGKQTTDSTPPHTPIHRQQEVAGTHMDVTCENQ